MSYGQWVVDKEATIKEFGYSPDELSYGSRKPVKCVCESCGIKADKRFRESSRKHICKSIIDGKKRCFKCKTFKLVEEFSKNRSTFDGYQKVCKNCFSNYDSVKRGYKKKSDNLKIDLELYLANKISTLNKKCKLKNLDFDLVKGDIYELFKKQNGLCYYTGIEIKHNRGCSQYDSISVDRLDPNIGYVKSNIVLASYNINSLKGMMTESEFKEYLKIIIPKLDEYKNK